MQCLNKAAICFLIQLSPLLLDLPCVLGITPPIIYQSAEETVHSSCFLNLGRKTSCFKSPEHQSATAPFPSCINNLSNSFT